MIHPNATKTLSPAPAYSLLNISPKPPDSHTELLKQLFPQSLNLETASPSLLANYPDNKQHETALHAWQRKELSAARFRLR